MGAFRRHHTTMSAPPATIQRLGGPSRITVGSPVIDRRYRLCRCSAPAPVKSGSADKGVAASRSAGSAETQRRRLGLRLQRLLIAALILLNPFRVRKRLVGPLPTGLLSLVPRGSAASPSAPGARTIPLRGSVYTRSTGMQNGLTLWRGGRARTKSELPHPLIVEFGLSPPRLYSHLDLRHRRVHGEVAVFAELQVIPAPAY